MFATSRAKAGPVEPTLAKKWSKTSLLTLTNESTEVHNARLVLLVSSNDFFKLVTFNLDNYVMGSNCYVPTLACTKKKVTTKVVADLDWLMTVLS